MKDETKDFQQATAERVVELFDGAQYRVLVADEVGLGKTFVAKRVIELLRERHRQRGEKTFRVVYICSNATVAEQNISKLGIQQMQRFDESRLSMQHLQITKLERGLSRQTKAGELAELIIPLTPMTSFRTTSSWGTAPERALMYVILSQLEELRGLEEKLTHFLNERYRGQGVKWWEAHINTYQGEVKGCGAEYLRWITKAVRGYLTEQDFSDLTKCFEERKADPAVFNRFRQAFAHASIERLRPDLVIMDEFQRFSDLLTQDEDERSMLARNFLSDRAKTRVLLLSATPYKPYTTLAELNELGCDEHYSDFRKLVSFLSIQGSCGDKFSSIWERFSRSLARVDTDYTTALAHKEEAQEALYSLMCRTERLDMQIIDDTRAREVEVSKADILSYVQGQRFLDLLQERKAERTLRRMPIEYVKSSPYLVSFMDRYEHKRYIERVVSSAQRTTRQKILAERAYLLLPEKSILSYRPIPPNNARLRYLHDLVFGAKHQRGVHLLLWVPASRPYYQAGGIFETEEAHQFSKLLIFSSWEIVPRMLSVMMSYYAELYTLGKLRKENTKIDYLSDSNGKRYGEGRLQRTELLEEPCVALAQIYHPAETLGRTLDEVRDLVRERIKRLVEHTPGLASLPQTEGTREQSILSVMKILDRERPSEEMKELPSNVLEILTDIAIGSPAVCAYRLSGDSEDARTAGKAIASIFNKAESAAIIDLIYRGSGRKPYYERVLDYCVRGNLQAVLDEYAHLLGAGCLGSVLKEAILDTGTLSVDTDESVLERLNRSKKKDPQEDKVKLSMRTHFAVPFVDKMVTEQSITRSMNVRKAFNSPFRPFILSSTSVGQEGLDFHWYSRKVVHWNLPSNPVDLEQREGRINRYKCLAIRRNVATLYGERAQSWDEMFDLAREAHKGAHSDMVPTWYLPFDELTPEDQARLTRIERIVPMYPMSRDRSRYERLIQVLSLYRMTLGHPRQDELTELLQSSSLTSDQLQALMIDLCPFNCKRS